MDALLDDDVGIAVGEKFANIRRKHLPNNMTLKLLKRRKRHIRNRRFLRKLLSLITLTVKKIT